MVNKEEGMQTIQIQTALIAVAGVFKPPDAKILLRESQGEHALPLANLSQIDTSESLAAYILKEYTGIAAIVNGVGFVPLMQKRIVDRIGMTRSDGTRYIIVPYLTILREEVPLKLDGIWISISQLQAINIDKQHLEILVKILQEG
jgi:hypothetical protein